MGTVAYDKPGTRGDKRKKPGEGLGFRVVFVAKSKKRQKDLRNGATSSTVTRRAMLKSHPGTSWKRMPSACEYLAASACCVNITGKIDMCLWMCRMGRQPHRQYLLASDARLRR